MSMICISGGKECTGCMSCREESEYYCPVCGEQVEEHLYKTNEGEIVGCENCISTIEPWEGDE